jgi:membrane-associated phospholipid phosphatase
MKNSFAKFVSFIGHPLLTIPLFVAIVMFAFEDLKKASFISFIIIGCVFVPLILWMFIKSKNGSYTNFDVSDKIQRNSLFLFIIPFLIIATIILYTTGQSIVLWISVFFGLVITLVSQIVNIYVKSSLHVSLNIYLSFLIIPINYKVGVILLIMTILIGWSRIVLGRHTLKEVIIGAGIGLFTSLIMNYIKIGL